MNQDTDEPDTINTPKRSRILAALPALALMAIAIGFGIFVNLQSRNGNPESQAASFQNEEQLNAVQTKLVNSTVLPDSYKTVPAFELLSGNNEPVTEALLDNKWSVLFFGFINCPDICPISLSAMNTAVGLIDQKQLPVPQVVFITVDPARDTVEKTAEYVAYFNKDFIGISGELTGITELSRALNVVSSFTANDTDPKNYTVDHTASMLLIDPQRRVRAKLNAPHDPKQIAEDYATLMSVYN